MKNMSKHAGFAFRTVVLFLLIGIVIGLHVAELVASRNPMRRAPTETDYKALSLLTEAYFMIQGHYVTDVDRAKLAQEGVRGMLRGLDPYSVYITPRDVQHFNDTTHGRYEGLGIRIIMVEGHLTVESPLEGSPAFNAGVLPGDRIVRVDGEKTAGMTLLDAVDKLKGPAGSNVTLTVRHRESGELEDIVIVRAKIEVPSTAGLDKTKDGKWNYWVDEKLRLAYIRVTAFQENTGKELKGLLENLNGLGMRGLVLDLRFNPGGLLDAAIEVSNLFIPDGVIVSTRGRTVPERRFKAVRAGTFGKVALVVLVNEWSASASEIVAGAIQDLKRGKIVGAQTFGKGSVQNVFDLTESKQGAIKLTVGAYYTPSGRSLYSPKGPVHEGAEHKPAGLMPDVVVAMDPKKEDLLRKRWASTRQTGFAGSKPASTRPVPVVDNQLDKALEVLKKQVGTLGATSPP